MHGIALPAGSTVGLTATADAGLHRWDMRVFAADTPAPARREQREAAAAAGRSPG